MTDKDVLWFNAQFEVLADAFNNSMKKCAEMQPDDFVKYMKNKTEEKVNSWKK